ncbi:MAG: hypothetical protein AAGC47_03140 [Bacteroidota bacterium]
MYKLTVNGKTMVGCNEDAWRTTSKIWFENADNLNGYGAGFTGSRQVGSHRTAPQSGMNEKGLTFSRLTAYYPKLEDPIINRPKITNEVDYLTDILHQCATVEEVKNYIEQYDHSIFLNDVFIYIDSTGKYLIVEPYQLIEGNEPYYVLSNFCPSITDNDAARNLDRYRKGEDFLKTHDLNSSLSFCSALSDTMHVCRSRNGDGTLLTSIWDTKDGLVNLYFYHDYDSTVQFNLTEELLAGNHSVNIPELFPANAQFERLKNYKTPFNTPELRVGLAIVGGFLSLFSFFFSIASDRSKNNGVSIKAALSIAVFNLLITAYLFILATDIYIYYFDAPYQHYNSKLISASSYIPFALLLAIIPTTLYTIKLLRSVKTKRWIQGILVFNNFIYLILIVSFSYWGLYSIWN